MMNYQEFKKELIAQLEEQIKQLGLDVELRFDNVVKNNGVCMEGIILKGASNIAPTVYANQLYPEYESGRDIKMVAFDILQNSQRDSAIQKLNLEECMNWKFVKDHVIIRVIGSKENQDRQENFPFRKEVDLLLTYQVLLEVGDEGAASYQVTKKMQETMGVTEEELYQAAVSNMPRLLPPSFENMNDTIEKMISGSPPEEAGSLDEVLSNMEKAEGMYVISNREKYYGAATIFYPEVMDKIAQAFDRDMVVLPSSLHEAILMPYMPEMDLAEAKAMVMEINETQVMPEEVLANQVYVYDKEEKKLVIGDEWKEQKLKQELKPKQSLKDSLKEKQEQVAVQPNSPKRKESDMEH